MDRRGCVKRARQSGHPAGTVIVSCLTTVAVLGLGLMARDASAQVQTYFCPSGFEVGVAPAPPIPLTSLKTVANPVLPNGSNGAPRADLADYIANQTAAIRLGKALFWDMQAGSDNKTACATCHAQAGGDVRTKNQINPGANGVFNNPFVPNDMLLAGDFPFTIPGSDTDDIAGSQGVRKASFVSVSNAGVETSTAVADLIFNVGGVNVRQVTGMNTPSAINAVFNHRNFWNGRAQPEFNGVNPWGSRDLSARVWVANSSGTLSTLPIRIQNASPASQAVGPVLNDVEMSAIGRTFPDVGKKLLRLKPLGLQKVDARDSMLGKLADTRAKGLKTTYTSLIQQAFQSKWWSSSQNVTINGKSYSMMEANFSLFWGLAIMLYEATLVSDDSPMDQFLAGRTLDPVTGALVKDGNPAQLNSVAGRLATDYGYTRGVAGILNGLKLFEQPLPPFGAGRECVACHMGANTTSASVANLVEGGQEPGGNVFKAAGFDLRMERMFMQVPPLPTDLLGIIQTANPAFFTDWITFDPGTYAVTATHFQGIPTPPFNVLGPGNVAPTATYDAGWYNVGVRPPADNPGVGGTDPFGSSLSWVGLYQETLSDPGIIKVPGGAPGCAGAGNATFPGEVLNASGFPLLSGPLRRTEPTDALASFKTSALRNVELTGPYFHNGGKSTLSQVVEFYDDGGDFPAVGDPARGATFPTDRRSPLVRFYGDLSSNGFRMTLDEVDDLVAFLLTLTDDRVRYQRAPFDHPELIIPNGQDSGGNDLTMTLPAVGAAGSATPLRPFLTLNPFQ